MRIKLEYNYGLVRVMMGGERERERERDRKRKMLR